MLQVATDWPTDSCVCAQSDKERVVPLLRLAAHSRVLQRCSLCCLSVAVSNRASVHSIDLRAVEHTHTHARTLAVNVAQVRRFNAGARWRRSKSARAPPNTAIIQTRTRIACSLRSGCVSEPRGDCRLLAAPSASVTECHAISCSVQAPRADSRPSTCNSQVLAPTNNEQANKQAATCTDCFERHPTRALW